MIVIALTITHAAPLTLSAQYKASERALVAQTVDGTRITVDYSRPRARGRTNMYGGMEKWGRAWTPGADDATTLAFDRPVTILGQPVPPGKYSVWLVLREHEQWTLVLDPRDTLFHTAHPDSTAEQHRMTVQPLESDHTEVLTWDFPGVTTTGTTLRMRWGLRGIEIPIGVTPAYPPAVSAAHAAPYLGTYEFAWTGPDGDDPAESFTVEPRSGQLFGKWAPDSLGRATEVQLLPAGEDRFVYGAVRNGETWAINDGLEIVFLRAGGVVTGFEFRNGDRVLARARREER